MSTLSLCYFRNIPSPLRRPCPQGLEIIFFQCCLYFAFFLSLAFHPLPRWSFKKWKRNFVTKCPDLHHLVLFEGFVWVGDGGCSIGHEVELL